MRTTRGPGRHFTEGSGAGPCEARSVARQSRGSPDHRPPCDQAQADRAGNDLASKYIAGWTADPLKSKISIRHLASHTSGISDAEQDGLPHDQFPAWKGDYWKRTPDPFSIAVRQAPVLFGPGTPYQYSSNPDMAALAYAVTAALRGGDTRSLLKESVLDPLGVPERHWSVGYGRTYDLDGLKLYANWGGASLTARDLRYAQSITSLDDHRHRVRRVPAHRDDEVDQSRPRQNAWHLKIDLVQPRILPLRAKEKQRQIHAVDGRGQRTRVTNPRAVQHQIRLLAGSTQADRVRHVLIRGRIHHR